MKEEKNKKKSSSKILEKALLWKFIPLIAIVVGLVIVVLTSKDVFHFGSKTTKLGFEDIGELATQSAYVTEVNVVDASREMLGIKIPLTQSKMIYSYDVVIKAGFNFADIKWDVKENKILVQVPKVKILSCEIDTDSFKLYHESESIFRNISMEENNKAFAHLKKKAKENAVSNGLLEKAKENGEVLLKSYFGQAYDLEKYEVVFE